MNAGCRSNWCCRRDCRRIWILRDDFDGPGHMAQLAGQGFSRPCSQRCEATAPRAEAENLRADSAVPCFGPPLLNPTFHSVLKAKD